MPDTYFSDDELAACALREWKRRTQVYPGRVQRGEVTQDRADLEVALMYQIYCDYYECAQMMRGTGPQQTPQGVS